MNIKINKAYIIMTLLSWLVIVGFSQDKSCYRDYIGEHDIDFDCNIRLLNRETNDNFVQTSNLYFYYRYPNLIKVKDLKECLSFSNAEVFRLESDSFLVVIPNGAAPVTITDRKDSLVIPVRSIPQVHVYLRYKDRVLSGNDSIPLEYMRHAHFFSATLDAETRSDSCIREYIFDSYILSNIEIAIIRNKKVFHTYEGKSVSELITTLGKKTKREDWLSIRLIVRIGDKYSKNVLYSISII